MTQFLNTYLKPAQITVHRLENYELTFLQFSTWKFFLGHPILKNFQSFDDGISFLASSIKYQYYKLLQMS